MVAHRTFNPLVPSSSLGCSTSNNEGHMKVGDIVTVPALDAEMAEFYGLGTIIKYTGRLNNRDCFLILFARTGDEWGFHEDELQIASVS